MPAAIHEVSTKSALTRVQGMPFEWSINPYRGCEHACAYCYARDYHFRMGRDVGAGFDREIEAKVDLPEVLRRELASGRRTGTIALGTGTDPYQQAEGRYRITRRALEVLLERPLPLIVITKGTLVVRDADLLARLGERVDVSVNLSIPTVDEEVARSVEPHAPPPRQRLRALRMLRDAGVSAGILCAPVLPGLTDHEPSLLAVARAAREHGALWLSSRTLKLDPGTRSYYLPFLASRFPQLVALHERRYAAGPHPDRGYRDLIERRFERVLAAVPFPAERPRPRPPQTAQLRLAI